MRGKEARRKLVFKNNDYKVQKKSRKGRGGLIAPPPMFMKGSGALSYTNYGLNSKSNPYLAMAQDYGPNKQRSGLRAKSSYGSAVHPGQQGATASKRKREIEQVMQKAKQIQLQEDMIRQQMQLEAGGSPDQAYQAQDTDAGTLEIVDMNVHNNHLELKAARV